ncbi:prolyl oligopeptidase family serine peptidase [Kribbella sp.]|uniref:prolyl oligopeptidase family serine peptidase n=1 Tax=Kribbella sp. TaxID=1871183 RepID=UPI002D5B3B7C|nr:prolyl oligopeptidase family serine peptidase [Kribbella sp.]HZX01883.1 prolyl oligopeptidase family serine peptidase [Kribbella sp.]
MHSQNIPRYPDADRRPVVDWLHGHAVADPYRWLEDATEPATRRWQAEQDELWLDHAAGLPERYRFRATVAELSAVGMVSPPLWRGGQQFFLRRTARQDHPVLYAAGPERALIDPAELDPTGGTTLDHWQPSPDGHLLAFQLSTGGTEAASLYVMDTGTGQVVDGPIDRCRYSPVAWLPDGSAFYFVRDRQVQLHQVGRPDDVVVLARRASYGLELSADGRWLTISAAHGARNDVWLADVTVPEAPVLAEAQVGIDARSALIVGRDGRLYVVTTLDAPAGRICVGDPQRPTAWTELVAEEADAPLSELALLDGPELPRPLLAVARSRHTIGQIALHDLHTGERVGNVPLPGLGTIGSLTTRSGCAHELWFSYTDDVTPATVQRYDARTGRTTLWAAPPGVADVPTVRARQIVYRSADGTLVRMLALARPGRTGPRPTILYGYGGFGQPLTPTYSSFRLAWVERGGVFVTANVRGGGEDGDRWHRAGRLRHKQNGFDDFIAAAETLVADGWTTHEQLAVCGESNGGLLVGAVVTQRPELFAAAVCSSPVLDMLRFEYAGLGAEWVPEYGSVADPDDFENLLAYSPYHHVAAGKDYPAVLFTASGGDTRVDPLHARKMCAALQHATSGERPILFRFEDGTGHGAAAVSRGIGLAADLLAFLGAHTGLTR